jgi:seryl-tRNA synthetase
VAVANKAVEVALAERDEVLYSIGNLVHQSVPVSNDEANNEVVTVWGTNRPQTPDLKHHHELLYMIGMLFKTQTVTETRWL